MNREEDFRPLDWAAKEIPRQEARLWWKSGFTVADALHWRERFTVDEALAWRAAGVTPLREARSWLVAGVGASEVAGWRQAGIGFAEAAAWREFGYSLEEARKGMTDGKTPSEAFRRRVGNMQSGAGPGARGTRSSMSNVSFGSVAFGTLRPLGASGTGPPSNMRHFVERIQGRSSQGGRLLHSYMMRQWFDDEALAFAEAGIDAGDALVWKEFGIAPAEAGRLAKAGQTPGATLRAWWEAGIPADEVAAWLGAGLTPEEAAAQRAKGVTAARAAVMRALRDPEEPSGQ